MYYDVPIKAFERSGLMHRIYNADKKYILLALYDAAARLGYEIVACDSCSGYLNIGVALITLKQHPEGINVCVTSDKSDSDSIIALLDEVGAILRD